MKKQKWVIANYGVSIFKGKKKIGEKKFKYST